jgi:hypothetical protein
MAKFGSVKDASWGRLGGTTPMHSAEGTGTQKPGQSAQEGSSAIGSSQDVQAGPSSAGFYSSGATNKDYAGTQEAGVTAMTKKGGNAKFAEGGKTPMCGNTGSRPAQAGRSGVG